MKYFSITLGIQNEQAKIIDQLKSNGFEVIQGSSGLYVKGSQVPNIEGLEIKTLDPEKILADSQAPHDLKAFLG